MFPLKLFDIFFAVEIIQNEKTVDLVPVVGKILMIDNSELKVISLTICTVSFLGNLIAERSSLSILVSEFSLNAR